MSAIAESQKPDFEKRLEAGRPEEPSPAADNPQRGNPAEDAVRVAVDSDRQEDNRDTSGDNIQPNKVLEKTARDIYLMVAHLSRAGKPLDEEQVKAALRLARRTIEGRIRTEEEGSLFYYYSEICKKIRPARIDALYYGYYAQSLGGYEEVSKDISWKRFWKRTSEERTPIQEHMKIMHYVHYLSLSLLALTILLSMYIAFTASIVSDSRVLSQEGMYITQRTLPPNSPIYPIWAAVGSTEAGAENRRTSILEQRYSEIISMLVINTDTLRRMNPIFWADDVPELYEGDGVAEYIAVETPIMAAQRSLNDVIASYVLPLITSLLGVCVYLVRESGKKFSNLSFTAREIPNYIPRFSLGAVAGILIGWFISPDAAGVVAVASPAALAFLAGYSVEFFFSVVDNVVDSVRGSSDQLAPEPQDAGTRD